MYRVKNLFCQKNNPKKFEFKNKVLPLQSLIVLNDTKVLSFTNLVILSIYLKHNTQTPTLSVIARLLSIWSEVQSLAYICPYVKYTLHLCHSYIFYRLLKIIVIMEKIFLLPNGFKKVGWIILVPTFVLGVLMTIDGYNGFPSFLLPEWIPLAMKRVLTSDWVGKILNNVAIIGICLGCLFVACSRERVEDELIGRIRLNSLLIALYINSSVLIILSLFCYELLFLNVLVFNMFTNIIIFLIVFEMKLWKLKKSLRDEE